MPYEYHAAQTVYVHEEYPKMLCKTDDDGVPRPVLYPFGHERYGRPVIFENADEEAAYNKPKAAPKPKAEPKAKDD